VSKLTQIESAIASLDAAGFQRLCDSYLHARGYERVNPIGLVLGSEKVKKGTPDTLIPLADGTYAFSEYTTQKQAVAAKLLADMQKCFDEAKTGIPVSRIHEFIGCHTSVLSAAEEHQLIEAGRARAVIVTLYGVGPIAHDLLQKFPGLARDHLGVEVDTGQILELQEFVAVYGQSALATPLDGEIRFREDEIKKGVEALTAGDLLIVTGPPGVGKSRLALEVCREYVGANNTFAVKAVRFRGRDLFDDVRVYFSAPGSYLIFVDDAHRVAGFDYFLQLLREQRVDRKVKIVATVRDYALPLVQDAARQSGGGTVQVLSNLKDENIRDIVKQNFAITNFHVLERISQVAQGNARIAVMAARVVKQTDTSASIADVSGLYEEYFSSIRQDIASLDDPELMRTAGILALFGKVDQANAAQIKVIVEAFGIDETRFWSAVRQLNDLEVVDLYENEIAQISDQVLATFLFYVAFFRDRVLDAAALLHPSVFPHYRRRVFDALNPALTAFDAKGMGERLLPILRREWKRVQDSGDRERLLTLVDAFGPLDPTATLALMRDDIGAIQAEPPDYEGVPFKADAGERPSFWSILGGFRDQDEPLATMALELAADLLAKRPKEIPHALSLFLEGFGIRHISHFNGFAAQRAAAEVLWKRASEQTPLQGLYLRLFLAVAEQLLHTHFQTHEMKTDRAFTMMSFDVPRRPELDELRTALWKRVLSLLNQKGTRAHALGFIRRHADSGLTVTDPELLLNDAQTVLPSLTKLDCANYAEGEVAQRYLQLLRDRQVPLGTLGDEVATLCDTSALRLAKLLVHDFEDLNERAAVGWREYQEVKRDRLASHVKGYSDQEFDNLITECIGIREQLKAPVILTDENQRASTHDEFQFAFNVGTLFEIVRGMDVELFRRVVTSYLARGNPLEIDPQRVVPGLVAQFGADTAYRIIREHSFPKRGLWLGMHYMCVKKEAVSQQLVTDLREFYETAAPEDLLRGLDYLASYETVEPRIVQHVVATMVKRSESERRFGLPLSALFDGDGAVGSRIKDLFGGSPEDIALLKRAYLCAAGSPHLDYSASAFSTILDLDPKFAEEWVEWMYEAKGKGRWVSEHDDHRDYSQLWLRDDYEKVMRSILERVNSHENDRLGLFSYAGAYYRTKDHPENAVIEARRVEVLANWIREASGDRSQMPFVFGIASSLAPEHRRQLIELFLELNENVEDFNRLPLEPSSSLWRGSAVPMLQNRSEFLESLVPLCSTLQRLDHRAVLEKRIAALREEVESEKRQNFLDT